MLKLFFLFYRCLIQYLSRTFTDCIMRLHCRTLECQIWITTLNNKNATNFKINKVGYILHQTEQNNDRKTEYSENLNILWHFERTFRKEQYFCRSDLPPFSAVSVVSVVYMSCIFLTCMYWIKVNFDDARKWLEIGSFEKLLR